MTDKLDKPIGTRESVKLPAKAVIVKAASIEQVKKKTGEVVGEKTVLSVLHPDAEDLVALSSVLYLKNKAVKQSALWYMEDADQNISKSSALAETMRFYKVMKIKDFVGISINTELDDKGYLTIKAY